MAQILLNNSLTVHFISLPVSLRLLIFVKEAEVSFIITDSSEEEVIRRQTVMAEDES